MIFKYGIKLIWPGGTGREEVIGFSPSGYRTWKTTVGIGTRMLLYETSASDLNPESSGRMAIISEVEVTSEFYKDEFTAPSPQHPWIVRVKPIRVVANPDGIPVSTIRAVLEDRHFPQKDETWRKLSEEQYHALIAYFETSDS